MKINLELLRLLREERAERKALDAYLDQFPLEYRIRHEGALRAGIIPGEDTFNLELFKKHSDDKKELEKAARKEGLIKGSSFALGCASTIGLALVGGYAGLKFGGYLVNYYQFSGVTSKVIKFVTAAGGVVAGCFSGGGITYGLNRVADCLESYVFVSPLERARNILEGRKADRFHKHWKANQKS